MRTPRKILFLTFTLQGVEQVQGKLRLLEPPLTPDDDEKAKTLDRYQERLGYRFNEEQCAFLKQVTNDDLRENVVVRAVPGSGKTSIIAAAARLVAGITDEKEEEEERPPQSFSDVRLDNPCVKTFHSFCGVLAQRQQEEQRSTTSSSAEPGDDWLIACGTSIFEECEDRACSWLERCYGIQQERLGRQTTTMAGGEAEGSDLPPQAAEEWLTRRDIIMVDEVQDTSSRQWHILLLLQRLWQCTLILIGDPHQSIFAYAGSNVCHFLAPEAWQQTLSSSSSSLVTTPWHEYKLSWNYRSTPEICGFLTAFLRHNSVYFGGGGGGGGGDAASTSIIRSQKKPSGQSVQLHCYPRYKAQKPVEQLVRKALGVGRSVWLVCRTNALVHEWQAYMLQALQDLEERDTELVIQGTLRQTCRLSIGSVHKAKGGEQDVVVVVGVDDGFFPLRAYGGGGTERRDLEAEAEEARALYVACSRAKYELHLVALESHRGGGGGTSLGGGGMMTLSRFLSSGLIEQGWLAWAHPAPPKVESMWWQPPPPPPPTAAARGDGGSTAAALAPPLHHHSTTSGGGGVLVTRAPPTLSALDLLWGCSGMARSLLKKWQQSEWITLEQHPMGGGGDGAGENEWPVLETAADESSQVAMDVDQLVAASMHSESGGGGGGGGEDDAESSFAVAQAQLSMLCMQGFEQRLLENMAQDQTFLLLSSSSSSQTLMVRSWYEGVERIAWLPFLAKAEQVKLEQHDEVMNSTTLTTLASILAVLRRVSSEYQAKSFSDRVQRICRDWRCTLPLWEKTVLQRWQCLWRGYVSYADDSGSGLEYFLGAEIRRSLLVLSHHHPVPQKSSTGADDSAAADGSDERRIQALIFVTMLQQKSAGLCLAARYRQKRLDLTALVCKYRHYWEAIRRYLQRVEIPEPPPPIISIPTTSTTTTPNMTTTTTTTTTTIPNMTTTNLCLMMCGGGGVEAKVAAQQNWGLVPNCNGEVGLLKGGRHMLLWKVDCETLLQVLVRSILTLVVGRVCGGGGGGEPPLVDDRLLLEVFCPVQKSLYRVQIAGPLAWPLLNTALQAYILERDLLLPHFRGSEWCLHIGGGGGHKRTLEEESEEERGVVKRHTLLSISER